MVQDGTCEELGKCVNKRSGVSVVLFVDFPVLDNLCCKRYGTDETYGTTVPLSWLRSTVSEYQ